MSDVNSASERPYSVVPSKHASHTSTGISSTSHSQYTGAHDSIRHGLKSVAHDVSHHTHHPIQNRLEKWDETRDALKLNVHRNMYGLGAPAHTLMERKIAAHNPHFPHLHGSNTVSQLHLDILNGTDEGIEPREFLPTRAATGAMVDMHTVMERKHGL